MNWPLRDLTFQLNITGLQDHRISLCAIFSCGVWGGEGVIEYYVHLSPLPATLAEMKMRITATVVAVDADRHARKNLGCDYRMDRHIQRWTNILSLFNLACKKTLRLAE